MDGNASLTAVELPVLTAVGELYLSANQGLSSLSAASLTEVGSLTVNRNDSLTSFAGLTGLTSLGQLILEETALADLSHLAAASATGCLLYAFDNAHLSNADFVALRDVLDPSQAMGVALYYNGNDLDGDGDGVPARDDCNDADGNEGESGSWYWGPVDGDGDGVPRQYCSAGYGCLDSGGTPPTNATASYGDAPNDDCDDGDPNLTGLDGDGDGTSDCTDCNDSDPGVGFEFGTSGCPAVSCLTLRDQLDQVYGPQSPEHNSATYWIDPAGTGAFQTYCDMDTDGGGWTQFSGILLNSLSLVAFSQPVGSGNANGWTGGDTFDLNGDSDGNGDETLRADAVLPLTFTELFGSWMVPVESGHHADDNQSASAWGGSASSCSGWMLFGTPDTLLKVGGEWGGDFNSSFNHDWIQAQTTVPVTDTLRWENNQQCAWPDESARVTDIDLYVR